MAITLRLSTLFLSCALVHADNANATVNVASGSLYGPIGANATTIVIADPFAIEQTGTLTFLHKFGATTTENGMVRKPPSISEPLPKDIPPAYFEDRQKFFVPCIATGTPTPESTWLHNGLDLDLNKINIEKLPDGIMVKNAGHADEGEYQCLATNQWGTSLSQLFTVKLALLGDFSSDKIITNYEVNEGKHLVVHHERVECVPPGRYNWRKVDATDDKYPSNVVRTKRIVQDMEGRLYFTSVQQSDDLNGQKIYKVDISHSLLDVSKGGSYSKVTVNKIPGGIVNTGPSLIYPASTIQKMVVLEGHEMRLQCIFSGYPDVEVTWTGPQKGLLEEANTRMYIKQMSKKVEGTYTCTGRNSAGMDSKSIEVKQQTVPKFTVDGKPLKQTLSEREIATFVCQTTPDTDPPATVNFMINGIVITDSIPGRATEIFPIENGLKMTITDLMREHDIKVVQCKASNKHKTIYIDAPLNVLLRTILTEKPANQILDANTTNIVFRCMATSDPSTDVTITWTRDEKPLHFYDLYMLVGNTGNSCMTRNRHRHTDPPLIYTYAICRVLVDIHTTSDKPFDELYDLTLHGTTIEPPPIDPLMVDSLTNPSRLSLHLSGLLEADKAAYSGAYACKASNSYSEADSTTAYLAWNSGGRIDEIRTAMVPLWIILVILAGILLVTILILIICICIQRNKGDTYPVDANERKNGNDVFADIEEDAFKGFIRREPEEEKGRNLSQASLTAIDPAMMGSSDSLAQYSDITAGKFTEDGSFIGDYASSDRKKILVPNSERSSYE